MITQVLATNFHGCRVYVHTLDHVTFATSSSHNRLTTTHLLLCPLAYIHSQTMPAYTFAQPNLTLLKSQWCLSRTVQTVAFVFPPVELNISVDDTVSDYLTCSSPI